MAQEPQLAKKQNTSKPKKTLVLLMIVLLFLYWLIYLTPFMIPDLSLSNIVVMGSRGVYFYIPIVSTVLAISLLFYVYKKTTIWDRLYKILSALYIFTMISYILNMIFSSIYYRFYMNSYNNYNLDSTDYISTDPFNTFFITTAQSVIAEVLALIFVWFYAKVESSKNEK